MAYLTLGPEFHERQPKLYNRILTRVKGHLEKVVYSIHVIQFNSDKFGKNVHCIAVIALRKYKKNSICNAYS